MKLTLGNAEKVSQSDAAIATYDHPSRQAKSIENPGNYYIIPGVLRVHWDINSQNNGKGEIDVYFLFWKIDSLSGTVATKNVTLTDTLDIFDILTGELTIAVDLTKKTITAEGDIKFNGHDIAQHQWNIFSW